MVNLSFFSIGLDLKKRLITRNQDSNIEVEKRLKSYEIDMKHWCDYDYVIINENLENCFRQVENIISTYKNINQSFSRISTAL